MALAGWADSEHYDVLRDKFNALVEYVNTLVGIPEGAITEYYGSVADTAKWDSNGIGVVGTQYEKFALCLGQGLPESTLVNPDGSPRDTAPDKRGKFPVGYDPTNPKFPVIGYTGGAESVTLTANQSGLRNHNHNYTSPQGSGGAIGGSGAWLQTNPTRTSNPTWVDGVNDRDGAQNALEAHENLPPYLTTGYIIRYK